ncbi:unannotated protein [freshwater metagenome]|uniref:Unannotated protein n=1 Tax=freshwater metagenome TaxID=449393 RepID=A0A6J7UKL8_9ZZZZ
MIRTLARENPGGRLATAAKSSAFSSGTIRLIKIDGGVSSTVKSKTASFSPAAISAESSSARRPNSVRFTWLSVALLGALPGAGSVAGEHAETAIASSSTAPSTAKQTLLLPRLPPVPPPVARSIAGPSSNFADFTISPSGFHVTARRRRVNTVYSREEHWNWQVFYGLRRPRSRPTHTRPCSYGTRGQGVD